MCIHPHHGLLITHAACAHGGVSKLAGCRYWQAGELHRPDTRNAEKLSDALRYGPLEKGDKITLVLDLTTASATAKQQQQQQQEEDDGGSGGGRLSVEVNGKDLGQLCSGIEMPADAGGFSWFAELCGGESVRVLSQSHLLQQYV